MTDFRVLLEDLVEEVIDANQYMPPGVQSAIERARAALAEPPLELPTDEELLQIFDAACLSEGGTTDELHLRGLRAVLAADRARRPAPEPPAEGEVGELVDQLAGDQEMKIYRLPDLNGTIPLPGPAAPQPVPPTDEEIIRWANNCAAATSNGQAKHYWSFEVTSDYLCGIVRAALAHWSRQ